MTSEEDDEENKAAFEGEEEQSEREASSAADHQGYGDAPSPVRHDDHATISSKLKDEWPEIELGGEKGLVVCSIDVQLLTGGWAVCHNMSVCACTCTHNLINEHSATRNITSRWMRLMHPRTNVC